MNKDEICFMSACDMLEKIKNQELTSQEITETVIERIEKVNPYINAFCTPTFELAREMAKISDDKVKKGQELGQIEGIPTSIKDETLTKGIRTTFGSKLFEDFIPLEDAVSVKRLRENGCVILGKTNTPAFGYKGVTDNKIFGVTKNPWDLERTPGGSSGGAAASMASGLGNLALGSDGGGSIRIPSSCSGVYGIKPSFGRVPQASMSASGAIGTLVHRGPIVRYVRDAALMLDVMSGEDDVDRYSLPKPPYSFLEKLKETPKKLKIGYSLDLGYVKIIDPEVEKSVLDSAQKFEELEWSVEKNSKIRIHDAGRVLQTFWTSGFDQPTMNSPEEDNKVEEDIQRMAQFASNFTVKDIKWAELQRERIYEEICRHFKSYDILLTPTLTCTAFKLGTDFAHEIDGKDVSNDPLAWQHHTYPFNLSGHPAASIPCGWSKEGLPIGMQIIGKRLDDLSVLQVSQAFEEISPWQDKRPNFD
ncbi:MAG: amidase [Promethearchaeota archaeon]|jgi:Asp-tRNA(Asn)/Glu-tRNA(Gln) amidotransferase A subunit family amidase